ncbi:hypothetical protein S245_055548, partial [Arachis hypogaea]
LWLVRATAEAFRVDDAPANVFFLLMENKKEILPFCTQILQFQAQWKNHEAELNDRKIGKLCEYASKNPLRIPKINENLEQRCYKDLRNEMFGSVKVVLCIYRKFLSPLKIPQFPHQNAILVFYGNWIRKNERSACRSTAAVEEGGDGAVVDVHGIPSFSASLLLSSLFSPTLSLTKMEKCSNLSHSQSQTPPLFSIVSVVGRLFLVAKNASVSETSLPVSVEHHSVQSANVPVPPWALRRRP